MIDFHCHLDLYPDPQNVASEIQRRNIGVLSVTNTPSAWPGTSRLAQSNPAIRTALGLHPQLAHSRKREFELFRDYLPKTRFVGEVGLDGSPELRIGRPDQLEVFDLILDACAREGGKILSIHSRRSATEVLDRLAHRPDIGVPILHWFSGTKGELERAVSRDCWFSVGPSMLRGAKGRSIVEELPRSRVLLETDGPFAQHARMSLFPWDLELAMIHLSKLWRLDLEEVAALLRENERALLR